MSVIQLPENLAEASGQAFGNDVQGELDMELEGNRVLKNKGITPRCGSRGGFVVDMSQRHLEGSRLNHGRMVREEEKRELGQVDQEWTLRSRGQESW